MSDQAYKDYELAIQNQHDRNEARHIRTRVAEARRSPHTASLRWPFELLQNALDAGPRDSETDVTVRLVCDGARVVFEHNGAPFTSLELAALLSGGSSKEFESELTTGRFGTGFLVTHVLAERTILQGLLAVPSGREQFQLILDRGGDEQAILQNIRTCNESIRLAQPIDDLDGVASAQFEYQISDGNSLSLGLDALRVSLPYLYATRKSLGRVAIEIADLPTDVWTPGELDTYAFGDGYVESRSLRVERDGDALAMLKVLRFLTQEDGPASALVLLEQTESGWRVRPPEAEAPRVYREYPLRGSGFLPIEFVLDGKFDPDQERSRLLMSEDDKALLVDSFAAAVLAVQHGLSQGWENVHVLCRASRTLAGFDPTDLAERDWWNAQLASFAEQIAKLPVVQCSDKARPAITEEGEYADFVNPRLLGESTQNETTVERMWPLLETTTELMPPRQDLAVDWTEIAEGWHELGLAVARITMSDLAASVRRGAETLDQLKVTGDHKLWLARFLDVVGECWRSRAGIDISVLGGLLPNQNGQLCSAEHLMRDGGVSEKLKEICVGMGLDLREQLFLSGFGELGASAELTYLQTTIEEAIRNVLSEEDAVGKAITRLETELREDERYDAESLGIQEASVRLLDYLWDSQGKDAAATARRIPLLTVGTRAVRWSPERMMMAPVCTWHEHGQPFSDAYPPDRVLADVYAGSEEEALPDCVPSLIEWGIAIADPITTDTPAELKDRRLAAFGAGDTAGVVISREEFSQIALLQPEVLNRCQEGVEQARALLGLVLCHLAPNDPTWREERIVNGRRAGEDVQLRLHGALWLADLKYRAWVPVPGEDGKPVKMVANATTLRDLLDPKCLESNDAAIELLSRWFEFDELDLRLLGIAPDIEKRQQLRDGLAKLVESGGDDPEFYRSLAQEVEDRRERAREVDRCRQLGLAVQAAIKAALEAYGLELTLVDRGFDYEVNLPNSDVLDDAATLCEIGPYLLEIKATTTGRPRLTPKQAQTAADNVSCYVLCVVDLRGCSAEELDKEWTAARVEPLARIMPDIGGKVRETCLFVELARDNDVGIRNESALRYEVPLSVWEGGMSIGDWVRSLCEAARG
jgi:hypothetical protein